MTRKLLAVLLAAAMLFMTACSSSGGKGPDAPGTGKNTVPSGIWVLRYYGDKEGEYVSEYNESTDYYGRPVNIIEKDILDYDRTPFLTLGDNGEGTYSDEWEEVQGVTFDGKNAVFEEGFETPYFMKGDFLWFKDQYYDHYLVMESVTEELLAKIKNGAFGCVELSKAEKGDLVTLGTYDIWPYNEKTESLKWRVLDRDGDRLLIMTDQLIDAFSFNYNPDMAGLDAVTWENSSLRAFLNDPEGFLLMFDEDELALIQTTHLDNKAANEELMRYWGDFEDDPNLSVKPNWSTLAVQDLPDDPDTDDKVFLLSFREVEKYFGKAAGPYEGDGGYPYNTMPASRDWIAYVTESFDYNVSFGYYDFNTLAGAWMTRTLSTDHHDEKMVTYITSEGQVMQYYTYTQLFVRPAMWIKVG